MTSIRKFHLLTVLLTACLVTGFAPSSAEAANGFNCDVTIPLAVEWSDYFDQVGEGLFFDDDECGLSAPFDQNDSNFSATSVSIALEPAPHITYASMYVDASQVEIGGENYLTVLRLADNAGGFGGSFVEIRVAISNKGARELRLVIKSDTSSYDIPMGLARPGGNVVDLEIKKSSYAGMEDGFAIADIGEGPVVVNSLVLWESLPTEARFGVVDVEGNNSAGTLVFQPIEMGYRFFSTYPQD